MKIGSPEGLPTGPVWFAPDYMDNRLDLDSAFQVQIQLLSGKQYNRATARIAEGGQLITTFAAVVRKAVLEVRNLEVVALDTGETLRPTNGKELVEALDRGEASANNDLLMKIAVACLQSALLKEGELGNLRRQRQSLTDFGTLHESGLAPVAATSPTTTSTNTETPFDEDEDATDPLVSP